MAYVNPLTKFPLSLSTPGSANTQSPNRQLQNVMPVLKFTPVGTIAHAMPVQLTPMSNRVNFGKKNQVKLPIVKKS